MGIVRFADGPAEGETLCLHRQPAYLRVVRELDGRWDALDQLDDEVNLGDIVFIYKRGTRWVHVRGGPCGGSGYEYHHTTEIKSEGMEDRDTWRAAVEALPRERDDDG